MRKKLAIFLVMAMALGSLPLFVSSTPAFASWDWCWDDPIIQIGRQTVAIDVGVPANLQNQVSGGTITVHVPKNVKATVLQDTPNPLNLVTTIVDDADGSQVTADILVYANGSLPVQVVISVEGNVATVVDGRTNQTISAVIDD